MKLRNKKTGEIGYLYANKDVNYQVLDENDCTLAVYDTLPRLIEDWEDYEEPKSVIKNVWFNSVIADAHIVEIDFINDEEAVKAVEKLKAWKRLKDKGFRFDGWEWKYQKVRYEFDFTVLSEDGEKEAEKDLDLLFGGEQ